MTKLRSFERIHPLVRTSFYAEIRDTNESPKVKEWVDRCLEEANRADTRTFTEKQKAMLEGIKQGLRGFGGHIGATKVKGELKESYFEGWFAGWGKRQDFKDSLLH